MKKTIKITLWSICGVFAALLIALCVLLYLGFRFTPEAAVHKLYRSNTHIHTDEYDFFLHDVTDETGKASYADGHSVIKRYGFLYKEIDRAYRPLVAENGESVGQLYSYEGKSQTYCFIHWSGYPCPDELLPESDSEDDVATAIMYVKYRSESILYNGEKTDLFHYCYFVTKEPMDALVIKDTNVYAVQGIVQGKYWNDEKVMVINTGSDIDAEQLKAHYENDGIIVVRDWRLANDVEAIVRSVESGERDEKDLATVFCKSRSGAPYTGVVQGNASDLEREIDEMVAGAKSKQ